MTLDPTALRDLARDLGVGTDYWGWDGELHDVSTPTLHAVLAALGHDVRGDEDVARVRADRDRAAWRRTLPDVVVLRQDQEQHLAVRVDHGTAVQVEIAFEDGSRCGLEQVRDDTAPVEVDGTRRGQAGFHLPSGLPLGWHRLLAHTASGDVGTDLVVTPERMTVHEQLAGRAAVGLQAQLYSVRSPRSWGIGDLGDLRDMAAITAVHHGLDFVLVNPLHASFPSPPMEPSPYLPVTRRFTNPLYLRIEDVPEFGDLSEPARQRLRLLHQDLAPRNDRTDLLERDDVLAAKLDALEELYAVPRTPARTALLTAYRRQEGAGLEDYALWCALVENLSPQERDSPALPRSEQEIARARAENAERISFHVWLQFLLDEQLAAAQQSARTAGMRIGIMHDLAVGVEQTGADAWSLRDCLAEGIGVGAPADQYNQQGQNWHQPPWHPEALRRAGYRPWRDMLRSLMRHAGALRIDHVLGLFRLWWIPEGHEASDGAYVHYDHEAMIGILALEAERSGTIVIGEDLGTFEPWVRDYLRARGVLGTSILWFENDSQGDPLPPERYRRLCLASVNTHDLPPTAGYLAGDHVALRDRLGLLERPLAEELAVDEEGREKVLAILRADGLLGPEPSVEETIIALHRHLARTPSLLLGVSLVDCVGERRIQNQPGTDEEYANWRIPLAGPDQEAVGIDDLATSTRMARLLRAVQDELGAPSPEASASQTPTSSQSSRA